MRGNFDKCLEITLTHEGGWSDRKDDPGGATMRGVTIATFRAFKGRNVTKAELRNISDADLQAIYRKGYWDKVRGDDLPAGLDLVAFDAAVNSGPARGARWLQSAVGATADGKIGPATIKAAASVDAGEAIERAIIARLNFLRNLETYDTFGKGWERRVAEVKRAARAMADWTPPVAPAQPQKPPMAPVEPSKPSPAPEAPKGGLWAVLRALVAWLMGKK